MTSDDDDLLLKYKLAVRQRLIAQLDRHRSVSPSMSTETVVDMQIQQERQKLEKMLNEATSPAMTATLEALILEAKKRGYLPLSVDDALKSAA